MLAAQVGQATLGQSAVPVQQEPAAAAVLLAVAGLPVLGLAEPAAADNVALLVLLVLLVVLVVLLRAALATPTAAAEAGSSRALGHVASAAPLRRQ